MTRRPWRARRVLRRVLLAAIVAVTVTAAVWTRHDPVVSTVCVLAALTATWWAAFLWWEDWT